MNGEQQRLRAPVNATLIVRIAGQGEPEQVRTLTASRGVLATLDVRPEIGRWFSAATPSYDARAVQRFWARQGWSREPLSIRAVRLGAHPSSWATSRILCRVSSETPGRPFSAYETAPLETPARRAMSLMVTRLMVGREYRLNRFGDTGPVTLSRTTVW